MQVRFHASLFAGILTLFVATTSGCSALEEALAAPISDELHMDLPGPNEVRVPVPNAAGNGDYASPFTVSGELAGWAQAALDAAEPGSFLGAVRAQNASWWSTGVEMISGERAALEVNEATLEDAGGWGNVRATSDVTFDDVDDLAVYLYAKHGRDARFARALKVTQDLYPGLGPAYREAIRRAAKVKVPAAAPLKGYIRGTARAR